MKTKTEPIVKTGITVAFLGLLCATSFAGTPVSKEEAGAGFNCTWTPFLPGAHSQANCRFPYTCTRDDAEPQVVPGEEHVMVAGQLDCDNCKPNAPTRKCVVLGTDVF